MELPATSFSDWSPEGSSCQLLEPHVLLATGQTQVLPQRSRHQHAPFFFALGKPLNVELQKQKKTVLAIQSPAQIVLDWTASLAACLFPVV